MRFGTNFVLDSMERKQQRHVVGCCQCLCHIKRSSSFGICSKIKKKEARFHFRKGKTRKERLVSYCRYFCSKELLLYVQSTFYYIYIQANKVASSSSFLSPFPVFGTHTYICVSGCVYNRSQKTNCSLIHPSRAFEKERFAVASLSIQPFIVKSLRGKVGQSEEFFEQKSWKKLFF